MNKTEPVREREERQALASFVVRLSGSAEVTNYGSAEVTRCRNADVANFGSGMASGAVRGGVQNFQTLDLPGFHTAELRKSETSRVPKLSSL